MLIITAPAKTLDLTSEYKAFVQSRPEFLFEAAEICENLKKQDYPSLKKTLHASDRIVEENFLRFQNWEGKHNEQNSRPAVLTFKGDIYKEMHPHSYNEKHQEYAQKSIRVLSGFYGVLRAYDLMQPYRLEMQSKLQVGSAKDLYEFWRPKLTDFFQKELRANKHKYLLNLASEEYAKALDLNSLKNWKVIKVDFKEQEGDKLKIVPIFAKKARGMMMEYCIRNLVEDPKDLKKFKSGGYKFKEEDKEGNLLFIR